MNKVAKKLIILTASLVITTGCAKTVQNHGQIIKEDDIKKIEVGKTTKFDVQRLLGSPSVTSNFQDNTWYYISSQTVHKPLSPNNLQSRDIYTVKFANSGRVASLTHTDEASGKEIDVLNKATPTQGQTLGILEQLIDNVGKRAF